MNAGDRHVFGEAHFFDGGADEHGTVLPGHHVAPRAPQHVLERRGVPREVQQLSADGTHRDGGRIASINLTRPAARRDHHVVGHQGFGRVCRSGGRTTGGPYVDGKTIPLTGDFRDARAAAIRDAVGVAGAHERADQAGGGDEGVIRDEQRGHRRRRDVRARGGRCRRLRATPMRTPRVSSTPAVAFSRSASSASRAVDRPGVAVSRPPFGRRRDPRHELVVETEAFDR